MYPLTVALAVYCKHHPAWGGSNSATVVSDAGATDVHGAVTVPELRECKSRRAATGRRHVTSSPLPPHSGWRPYARIPRSCWAIYARWGRSIRRRAVEE
jgi:hypothetical protein